MEQQQAEVLTSWVKLHKEPGKRLGKAKEWVGKRWRVALPIAVVVAGMLPASSLIGQLTMSDAERADRGVLRLKAQQAVEGTSWATGYDPVLLDRVNGRSYWLLVFRFEKTSGYVDDLNRNVTVRCASIYAAETLEIDGAFPKPSPFVFGVLRWPEFAAYCHAAGIASKDAPYTPATRQQLRQLREGS